MTRKRGHMMTIHMTLARIDTLDDLLTEIGKVPDADRERIIGIITALRDGYQEALNYLTTPASRLICAWCKTDLRPGSEPASHGICSECAAEMRDMMAKPDDKMGPE